MTATPRYNSASWLAMLVGRGLEPSLGCEGFGEYPARSHDCTFRPLLFERNASTDVANNLNNVVNNKECGDRTMECFLSWDQIPATRCRYTYPVPATTLLCRHYRLQRPLLQPSHSSSICGDPSRFSYSGGDTSTSAHFFRRYEMRSK
jgi:hypothetical protein